MQGETLENSCQFTPRQAFLFAFDEATKATVQSLSEVGMDAESIWEAFSEALALFHKSAVAVEHESFRADFCSRAENCELSVGVA
jgi:hypothetical protein